MPKKKQDTEYQQIPTNFIVWIIIKRKIQEIPNFLSSPTFSNVWMN